jgi:hypothetical protein
MYNIDLFSVFESIVRLKHLDDLTQFPQQHRSHPIYQKVLIYRLLSDLLICLRSINFFNRLSDFPA